VCSTWYGRWRRRWGIHVYLERSIFVIVFGFVYWISVSDDSGLLCWVWLRRVIDRCYRLFDRFLKLFSICCEKMSKPKVNKVYNFFKRNPSSMYVCQIDKCIAAIVPQVSYLERHIKHAHSTVYKRDFLNHNDSPFSVNNKKTDDVNVSNRFKVITIWS